MIKLHPRVRETSGYGIPTVNVNLYRMFMKHPQIIAPEETANAPRLIAGPDNRVLYTQGNRVYAYGLTEPGRYLTYRVNKNITDPETGKFLGQEVVFSGIANTLPYTDSALEHRTRASDEKLKSNEYYTQVNKAMSCAPNPRNLGYRRSRFRNPQRRLSAETARRPRQLQCYASRPCPSDSGQSRFHL